MLLYKRIVSDKGRITYEPLEPKESVVELDDSEIRTLLTVFVTGIIEEALKNLPPHKRHARDLTDLQNATIKYAKGSPKPITDKQIDACVEAWNTALASLSVNL